MPGSVPWLAWTGALSLLAVQVLSAARFDPASASAIVKAAGPVSVVLGVLVSQIGLLLYWLVITVLLQGRALPSGLRLLLAMLGIGFSVLLFPSPYALVGGLFVVLGLLIELFVSFTVRARRIAIGLVSISVIWAVGQTVWLPAELIYFESDQGVIGTVVHVVDWDDQWVTLLEAENRHVTFLESSRIRSRFSCVPASSWWASGRSMLGRMFDTLTFVCPETMFNPTWTPDEALVPLD